MDETRRLRKYIYNKHIKHIFSFLIFADSLVAEIKRVVANDSWIIGNLKHSAYLRVNYDETNWKLIAKQLGTDYTQIHEINRATLIDDAYNLGKAELIPTAILLDMVKHLEFETSHIPWTPAFDGLNYISNMIFSCNNWTYSAYKV